MIETQVGYLFKMHAKPGDGPALRALMGRTLEKSTDVERWMICSDDEDTDSVVGFEFYRNDEILALHEQNQDVSAIRAQVRDLLAEPPVRSVLRLTQTSSSLTRQSVSPIGCVGTAQS